MGVINFGRLVGCLVSERRLALSQIGGFPDPRGLFLFVPRGFCVVCDWSK